MNSGNTHTPKTTTHATLKHTRTHTFALIHALVQAKNCTNLMPTSESEWLTECFEVRFCALGNSCWRRQKAAREWHSWLISWVGSHTHKPIIVKTFNVYELKLVYVRVYLRGLHFKQEVFFLLNQGQIHIWVGIKQIKQKKAKMTIKHVPKRSKEDIIKWHVLACY